MAEEQFALTREGKERLQAQLQTYEVEAERLRGLLGDIQDDPGGNLENDEAGAFFQLQTDLEHAENRIGHIKFVLERALVQTEDPNPRRVDPGERVVVWDFGEARERTFDVLAGPEVELTYTSDNDRRQVAADSPIGAALVGGRVGDVVEVEVPDGHVRLAIRRIERPA